METKPSYEWPRSAKLPRAPALLLPLDAARQETEQEFFLILASKRVSLFDEGNMRTWMRQFVRGELPQFLSADFFMHSHDVPQPDGRTARFLSHLEIGVNIDALRVGGEDFSEDLRSCTIYHECYEVWHRLLHGREATPDESHSAALQAEMRFAAQLQLGSRLVRYFQELYHAQIIPTLEVADFLSSELQRYGQQCEACPPRSCPNSPEIVDCR